jgi:heme/copper-type cytochrome/quinol oxidase subunit 3
VTRFVHDVSGLPDHAFDTRSLTWWGVLGYVAIEGAAFALAIAAYFFLRGQEMQWPPSALAPSLGWGTVTLVLLLLSELPNIWLGKAARAEDLGKVRTGLIVVSVAIALVLVSRAFEFAHLNIAWDRNAYGSIIWALLLLHTVHVITDLYETLVLTALMHTRHGEEGRRFVDTSEDVFYWHFIVISWVLLYLVIYWMPRL